MTTLAMYMPEGRKVDLANLSLSDFALIGSLHGRIRRGDRVLVCLLGGIDNGELCIRKIGDKYWAVHFPGGAHGGSHDVATGESDEHRRQKDYWHRAAEDSGYGAVREVRTGNNTIVDVAIYGSRNVGIEVQRSPITPRSIKSRTTKTFRAGLLPVWFTDAEKSPHWLHKVPSLGCNRLPWDHLPPRRAATATGLRSVETVRCTPGTFGQCLADPRRRPCGKYHPSLDPLRGLTVDDVAAMVPSGALVPLTWHNGYIYLTTPSSAALYRELTGLTGDFEPGNPSHETNVSDTRTSRECLNLSHVDRVAAIPAASVTIAPSDAAPFREMPREVAAFLQAHADEYRQVARIARCARPYPDDNTCHRCDRASQRPLVPFRLGWHCKNCAYPSDPDRWEAS